MIDIFINRFKNSMLAQNASWIVAGRLLQMIISLIVGIFSARYLGPSNYGLVNYGMAYTAFFTSLCTLGMNSILVKEILDDKMNEGTIIGTALGLKVCAGIVSAIMIVCLVSIVDKNEPITIIVTAICSISLVFQGFETINYWFQSQLNSKVTAIVSFVGYSVMAVYKVVLLFLKKDVQWFAAANVLDYACVGVLLLVAYKQCGGKKLKVSFKKGKELLSRSKYYILPGLMVAIYGYTDKVMLKKIMSETEVGYYSTATAICGMWVFVLVAIIDSFYPVIVNVYEKDKEEFKKKNIQLYSIILYVSFFVSTIICIFAPIIIKILYGNEYIQATEPLRILTWYTAFAYLGTARDAWIVCENKQKYLIYIYVCSALTNIVLNIFLIPILGASGASIASLLTQFSTIFVVPYFIKPLRENWKLMIKSLVIKK